MTTTVLAYIPSPAQGVWHLGPIPIRAYAVFIILGIIAALIIGDRRWVARGGQAGVIYDVALWAVPFGLIGGRLYHLATDWRTYFGPDGAGLLAALKIWDGGLGIWGAVALGGVGAWIACRQRGISLPAFGDAIAPGIILAQAIGRLGNYFNQELYGRVTNVPWGLEIFYRRDPSGIIDVHSLNGVSTGEVAYVVHPTFLYELLWNLLVFAVLILVDRRFKMGHGRLFALYVAGYCVGRFWVELMRDDTATHIDGIRINSFTSTFVFIGAVVYIVLAPKGREDPATLSGKIAEAPEDHELASELAKELAVVAGGTGVVAAATVAGREEEEAEERSSGSTDRGAAPEPEAEPEDADDIEPAEDEAILEAEVAAPDVTIETAADAEDDLIDEDHDPVDDEDFEGEPATAMHTPMSEQEELLEPDSEADREFDEDEEAAQDDAVAPAVETPAEPEPEAEAPEGSAADDTAPSEDEALVEAEAEQIDEDHDPVDHEAAAPTGVPESEQSESLEEDLPADEEFETTDTDEDVVEAVEAAPEALTESADSDDDEARLAGIGGTGDVADAIAASNEAAVAEETADSVVPESVSAESEQNDAPKSVLPPVLPPVSEPEQGSRLSRLFRRRR